MTQQQVKDCSLLMRQKIYHESAFELINDARNKIVKLKKDQPGEVGDDLWYLEKSLTKALGYMKGGWPPTEPANRKDGLHDHLRATHQQLEEVLTSLFLFQKEWEDEYAYGLQEQCAELQKLSSSLVKHLEVVGYK
jgi:hypothetical protein